MELSNLQHSGGILFNMGSHGHDPGGLRNSISGSGGGRVMVSGSSGCGGGRP